jgi:aminoglycoside phosphotransferase (APT) family kinase protein
MGMNREQNVGAAMRHFAIEGTFSGSEPYGTGHINDTYRVVFADAGKPIPFLVQRINHNIFKDPPALMENIGRVTSHLAAKLSTEPDALRRALTLISSREGRVWHQDEDGNYWRVYRFIENARSYDTVQFPDQAYQAARAFGRFQQVLSSLPAPRLHDTIPDFHNTPKRFKALEEAIAVDAVNRSAEARPEIDFALARQEITGVLLGANLPERVTHNDTKINNVLLDDSTGEGMCVIDLDTVMPGLALYDFGDMVRTATSPANEDERDLSKVAMQFPMFEALVRGYLSTAGDMLTKAERQYLAFSGKLITYEIGIRFLADYLAGDCYFKVHRPCHNLDRARAQFALLRSIEQQEDRMQSLVESL